MTDREGRDAGRVETLRRYPVKSMLGEDQETLVVRTRGVLGDRAWAVLDRTTGKIASAKRPKLWRGLLTCAAGTGADKVEITLPNGNTRAAGDPGLDDALSSLTGRTVRLIDTPPEAAEIDRAYPEVQLAEGLDADVDYSLLVLGGGAPPGTFLDYAAMHLMPTATVNAIAAAIPDGTIEPERYRPNVIIRSPSGAAGFSENAWADSIVRIGGQVVLRVILLTPRCSIPMLAHGNMPARPAAVRVIAEQNRVEIPGFGSQPCAGVYASVLEGGIIRKGDRVTVAPG